MPFGLRKDPRPGGIVLPRYDGRSLLNLPASICAALGVPPPTDAPPLEASVLPRAMLDGVTAVVLLVVDGLGQNILGADADDDGGALSGWLTTARAAGGAVSIARITSIFPSSTMPALATLNTGLTPNEHGLLGWTVYLEEFGEASELARWGPARDRGSFADKQLGGHDPHAFFGRTTLHRHLRTHGVRSTAVCPVAYRGSGYTDMIFEGARYSGYFATSSLPTLIDDALGGAGRRYVYAYWPTVDLVEHHAIEHDPLGGDVQAEIATLDFTLDRWFRTRRGRDRAGATLLLLTADHGHVFGSPKSVARLYKDKLLLDNLICPPTGERRLVYLHAKPGRREFVRAHCEKRYSEAASVLDPNDLFVQGLFGPGRPTAAARRRAGDVILLARGDWQLVTSHRPEHEPTYLYGNHGGLDPREMLVPLIAVRP